MSATNILRPAAFDQSEEPLHIRQQAGHQGWKVDADGWFKRMRYPSDPPMSTLIGFLTPTEVFVTSCALALYFDEMSKQAHEGREPHLTVMPPADCAQ